MSNVHFFNTKVATEYGINCAVILQHLLECVEHNKANNVNFYDNSYWTFNSTKAFQELFPYLSPKQIRTTLEALQNNGLIKTGNYNETTYDRTLWYALTEKGLSLFNDSPAEPVTNQFAPSVVPSTITVVPKTEDKKKPKISEAELTEEFNILYAMYPTKQGKKEALRRYLTIRKSGVKFEDVLNKLNNYLKYINTNQTPMQYIKQASTWFNNWEDEYIIENQSKLEDQCEQNRQFAISKGWVEIEHAVFQKPDGSIYCA